MPAKQRVTTRKKAEESGVRDRAETAGEKVSVRGSSATSEAALPTAVVGSKECCREC